MREPSRVLSPNPILRRCLTLALAFLIITFSLQTQAAENLLSQIQTLQDQNNIQISGLEKIQNAETVPAAGNVELQVKQLLAGYNHIVSRNKKGRIERIVILGKKEKAADNRILVPINKQNNVSTVSVSLSGDGRVWQTLEMIIDTGADVVVLPASLIGQLGLDESKLTPSRVQTVNGIAEARIGILREVKIANEIIDNVEAAFIADRSLGENRLLGMSALGRYQLSIDDKASRVTLIKR